MPETSSRKLPLGLLTVAATAAVAASQFTAAFGLTSLVGDLVKGGALVTAAIGWWRSAGPESRRQAGFDAPVPPRHPSRRLVLYRSGTLLLLLLAAWSLWPPFRHFLSGTSPWTLCGEFRSPCAASACLQLRDELDRPLRSDCLPLEDITGFKRIDAKGRFEYRPSSVGLRCQGEVVYRDLGSSMFSATCQGEMQW